MSRRTALRIGATLLVIAGLAGALVTLASSEPAAATSASPAPAPLIGTVLADSLGLTPVTAFPVVGCRFFVIVPDDVSDGVRDPVGYCMDSVATDDSQAFDIGQRLVGHVPSDFDWQVFSMEQQFAAADSATRARLASPLHDLLQEQAAQGG